MGVFTFFKLYNWHKITQSISYDVENSFTMSLNHKPLKTPIVLHRSSFFCCLELIPSTFYGPEVSFSFQDWWITEFHSQMGCNSENHISLEKINEHSKYTLSPGPNHVGAQSSLVYIWLTKHDFFGRDSNTNSSVRSAASNFLSKISFVLKILQ